MKLIDSHAHVDLEAFEEDLEEVLQRAQDAGVERMINISMGPEKEPLERSLKLSEERDFIFMAAGIHPHDAKKFDVSSDAIFQEVFQSKKVIAVGEIGLDFYYENSPRKAQELCFSHFLDLAKEAKLPVSIHSRDAFDETYSLLKNSSALDTSGGVMHCFTGDRKEAKRFLDAGAMISLSGIVTFKKAKELQEVAKYVPLDRLLVETDCPFLAPMPHRGKRNEPAFVSHVVDKVAELREISSEELAEATWKNAEKLFQFSDDGLPSSK